jgi:starvation-inducible DNA-binding protein
MSQPTPRSGAHENLSAWTDLEDSDEATIRYSVCTSLQACLADLIELQLQSKQAHWNVVGQDFRSLHLQLDEIVGVARTGGDDVAERIRALDGVPDGRSDKVTATSSLPAMPGGLLRSDVVLDLVADRLSATITRLRDVQTIADKHDPPSADLLNGIVLSLEKQRWMLRAAHDETPQPG